MLLPRKLEELRALLEPIGDPQERMALLVDSATARTRLPEAQRIEEAKVKGCISSAWISAECTDGKCLFRCAADSPLVAGLLGCLCEYFSDASPEEVAASEADPLASLGISRNLSPTRLNGLTQARKRIRDLASALNA